MSTRHCRNECKPLTILLADDSEPVRQALQRLFSSMPRFKVIGEADDGCQALEAITKLRPDLIILDIRMPGLSGLEVLQAIKTKSLPGNIIVFSQYGEKAYRDRCYELGASHFFQKVTEFDEFHSTLKQIQTCCPKPQHSRRNISHADNS